MGALAAALIAFLRTPAALRMRLTLSARQRTLQSRQARVQRGELVEVAPQPARAFKALFLWSVPGWPVCGLLLAGTLGVDLSCTRVAGWNLSLLLWVWTCWVLPLHLLAVSAWMARVAWRGLRQGCFPPVDSVLPFRCHGDRTWVGRVRAVLWLATPLLALVALVLSVQLHQLLLAGRTAVELTAAMERQCTRP